MNKLLIENDTFIELVSDLATELVTLKFGDSAFIEEDGGTKFSEEAQDFFNEQYDLIEFRLNKSGIYSNCI